MATSTINQSQPSYYATTVNTVYVQNESVHVSQFGKNVLVSGRFKVHTTKPSGQSAWLFQVPATSEIVSVSCYGAEALGTELIVIGNKITSNSALQTGNYNMFVAYHT